MLNLDAPNTRFRYLRDPLFLVCSFLYALNRLLIKPHMPNHEAFFRGYLNDLLLIPCVLPPLLFIYRKLSLRQPYDPPSAREIVLHLIVWSLLFEYVAPMFYARATSDPLDVVSYVIGGVVSGVVWNGIPRIRGFSERRA
jgi:cell shape-determining protein MreD